VKAVGLWQRALEQSGNISEAAEIIGFKRSLWEGKEAGRGAQSGVRPRPTGDREATPLLLTVQIGLPLPRQSRQEFLADVEIVCAAAVACTQGGGIEVSMQLRSPQLSDRQPTGPLGASRRISNGTGGEHSLEGLGGRMAIAMQASLAAQRLVRQLNRQGLSQL